MINIDKTKSVLNIDISLLKPNSYKEVFWSCQKCGIERKRKFLEANKFKLCLSCSNKINATKESSKIKSERVKKWLKDNGHPLKGVKIKENVAEALLKSHLGKSLSEETKKKLSLANSGKNNPFYGKNHTEESKQKMSVSSKLTTKRGKDSNFYGKISHSKGCWYETKNKKVWLRSSWEVKYAAYLDSLNIKWEYEPKAFTLTIENKECTYSPDFYLIDIDTYVEIKGYWRKDAKLKFKHFKQAYSNVKINVYGKRELKQMGIL